MANTTIDQLTSLLGADVANNDIFLVYDASAGIEKQISSSEMKNMVRSLNGTLSVTTTSTGDALVVSSTDSGAVGAPNIIFFRDSSSPAASDTIGTIRFRGKNSAGANIEYGYIGSSITTATAGSETGSLTLNTMTNGTSTAKLIIRGDGGVGVGTTSSAITGLIVTKPITGGVNAYGMQVSATVNTDVTTAATGFRTSLSTAASATQYTITNVRHYDINPMTIGANTIITNQYGFNSSGLTAANNNFQFYAAGATAANVIAGKTTYSFYSNNPTATGGGTSWNLYVNGTAPNYINGVLTIGTTTPDAAAKVQINSTTQGFLPPRMTTTQRNAIATPPAGLMIYNTSTNKLNFYNGTAWEAVTSA